MKRYAISFCLKFQSEFKKHLEVNNTLTMYTSNLILVTLPTQGGYTNLAYEGESTESSKVSGSIEPTSSSGVPSCAAPEGPSDGGGGDKVAITWCFALCFPAVFEGNTDGSYFTEGQGLLVHRLR